MHLVVLLYRTADLQLLRTPSQSLDHHFQPVMRSDSNVKHHISGTSIGTKFAHQYACMYMEYVENQFFKNEQIQPWV